MNKDIKIKPSLTENVKNAFKNFNLLTQEQQSAIMGGHVDSFQDNGIGEDLFPNYDRRNSEISGSEGP